MVKQNVLLMALLFPILIYAQLNEKERVPKKGLLRAQANIATGKMLSYNQGSIYVCGDLEYYLDAKTSLRGESFYFINATNKTAEQKLIMNHSIFSGAMFHLPTKGNLDPFIGIQPGLSITQIQSDFFDSNVQEIFEVKSTLTASPLLSAIAGLQYYAPKYFHLFANVRYVKGAHLGNTGRYNLDEMRFTFGLGFNLSFIK